MFSAALCSAMRRAACQGPRACAAPLLLPPSRRLRRALHTAGVLPAPIMADKREQERKALEQAQTVRAAMEEEERLRHERWRKWTPVEDAQYCTRKPSPLVAQPKGAKTLECTLAGFPSAGKSTLLCALVGHKVSATSRKPNTTQQPVVGVLTRHKTQVLFTDTPGIDVVEMRGTAGLEMREMADGAWAALQTAMVAVYVHDVRKPFTAREDKLLERLTAIRRADADRALVVALTHADQVRHTAKAELSRVQIRTRYGRAVDRIFPLNAKTGQGVEPLRQYLLRRATPGVWTFEADWMSDRSDVDLVDDIVREKIFRRFNQELPYQWTNATIGWTELANGFLKIDHAIYVYRPTHARLVQGALPHLHRRALRDIQGVLHRDCHLAFHVLDKSVDRSVDRTE